MASSSRKRHSDEDWMRHKPIIERMFIHEKKSLVETMQRLENDGFLVTKSQLEYRLKLWGFRRRAPKSTSDPTWQFIGHRVQRRQRQGKATEVVIDKRIIDAEIVRKEINRHQESTLAKVSRLQQNIVAANSQSAASPRAPDGLEVCLNTPAPLPMRFLWPASLPWSQFQDKFSAVFSAPSLLKNVANVSLELDPQKEDSALTHMLRFLVPQYTTRISVTQLAAEIGSVMPETYENENFGRASRLLQGTTDERYTEYVKMTLYKISNNLLSDDAVYREWNNITELLETSGIMKTPIQLENITDATMLAITEKLFQHAMREIAPNGPLEESSNGRLIIWSLKSGQNPDIRISNCTNSGIPLAPLQVAANRKSLPLMSRLLDHGACPDVSYGPWEEFDEDGFDYEFDKYGCDDYENAHPLLKTVFHYDQFDEGCLGMVKRLLETSSDVSTDSIVRMMMRNGCYIPELMEALIRGGADIFQSTKATSNVAWFLDTFSIIGCTALLICEAQELHPFFRLLEDAGIQNHVQFPEAVDSTSIVLLAAAKGNTGLLADLYSYGIDTSTAGNLGVLAIHVAAYYGHLETCKKLVLEHHTPVKAVDSNKKAPSPLHFAVAGGNLDTVRFFHQNKMDVNKVWEDEQKHWPAIWARKGDGYVTYWLRASLSCVDVALSLLRYDIAQYLLENGAKAPPWGAYFAREHDNYELAELALKAGADPSWGVCTPSAPVIWLEPIHLRFKEAMKRENTALAQQLVLDAQEDDLWNYSRMSILEAAIISCHGPTVERIFARNPCAYDPGALCAKVLFSASSRDSITIHHLLLNRPQSKETSDLEALAIGLAAWSGQMEVLKLLLAEFHQPELANAPYELRNGLPRFSAVAFSEYGLPFWHRDWALESFSPIVFALRSREALSLMLNHGYRPDRCTFHAAINDFDPDIVRTLLQSPRFSGCHDRIQGPLSYAARCKKYDIVRFLLENGADVNEDNDKVYKESNRNPLQSAVENNDLYLIDLLLKSGADVNAPAARDGGATALQLAAIAGQLGILRTLVDHGADINAPGAEHYGRTALEGAAEHGRIDVIQYLLGEGARTTGGYRLQYLRAIRYAELEAHMVAANLLRGHREWTKDDHTLWAALEGLRRWDLECFEEKTEEAPPSLTLLVDNTTLQDGSDHMGSEEDVYDSTEGMEPPDDLEDLEMRTNDPMAFMTGGM